MQSKQGSRRDHGHSTEFSGESGFYSRFAYGP